MHRPASSILLSLLLGTIPAACPGEAASQPCDAVDVRNARGNDEPVVLLDGWRDGVCQKDQVFRARGVTSLGTMNAPVAGCNSEIGVFGAGRAMALHAPENTWTDACGDVVNVDLDPPVRIPVVVWLVRPNAAGEANAAVLHARAVYDDNKTGIAFKAGVRDVTRSAAANQATVLGCENVRQLTDSEFYERKHINVYYVNEPWPVSAFYTGASCEHDRSVIFIGPAANLATLAHEFGHAFSLFGGKKEGGHSNDVAGLGDDNVMAGGGPPTRSHLSLGQAFRFNVDPRSWLNVQGLRTGPTHPCPARQPAGLDDHCPRLERDWTRP